MTVYDYGEHLYTEMLAAIRTATKEIRLETFIWTDDEAGQTFREALIEAADRGVEVFVIYDGFANLAVPSRFKELPRWLRQWSTVGTINIDRLSLMGNYEINAEFFDATLARHMEEAFETD